MKSMKAADLSPSMTGTRIKITAEDGTIIEGHLSGLSQTTVTNRDGGSLKQHHMLASVSVEIGGWESPKLSPYTSVEVL